MREVDTELKNALRREEPPAGFADRVLQRVAEPAAERNRPGPIGPALQGAGGAATRFNRPVIQWAAAAALVAAVAGGFDYVAKQKERADGETAKERVVLALHIASSKLQLVQTRINRLHEQPEKNSNQ